MIESKKSSQVTQLSFTDLGENTMLYKPLKKIKSLKRYKIERIKHKNTFWDDLDLCDF
jgi:hypothetical protein